MKTAIAKAEDFLLAAQNKDGSWIGEVGLNPGPTAQAVMLYASLQKKFPASVAPKAKQYVLRTQNPDGGWSTHPGAPSEVSLTCECYVALRLLGVPASDPVCAKARSVIEAAGGTSAANPWTQLYLGILGVLPWEKIQIIPIELVLQPAFSPFSIEHLAYWVRVITVPMMLVGAIGPYPLAKMAGELAEELSTENFDSRRNMGMIGKIIAKCAAVAGHVGVPGLRAVAIKKSLEYIRSWTEKHGDFGGNTCTAINVIVAYSKIGEHEEEVRKGLEAFMSYAIETEEEWRLQTCQSHVWDAAFVMQALRGENPSAKVKAALERGAEWLTDRQIVKTRGPWSKNVKAAPGGWCFGNRHEHFPVTDCTAVSVLALKDTVPDYWNTRGSRLAVDWLVGMQHGTGGWSAYEKFERGELLNRLVTFKDIPDALVDRPKADVSAKVVEALCAARPWHPELHSVLADARAFLLAKRETSYQVWRGNYGINYIYGTSFAAKALRAIDGHPSVDWAPAVLRFFLNRQNGDGGWGESDASYFHKEKAGYGPSTVTQTAWALLGLIHALDPSNPPKEALKAIKNGVEYLLKKQEEAGNWTEELSLCTVFPGMVYFHYEFYPVVFPLLALREAGKILAAH
ncbi:MAG: prenyltransferase/squalene oxidase repeat-containing protein [Bacteriovoracia bacterium]